MKTIYNHLIYILLAFMPVFASAQVAVEGLTVEMLDTPLAIEAAHPRLSYKLSVADPSKQRNVRQQARRIVVATSEEALSNPDLWDSGWVETDESILIPYDGKTLNAGDLAYWKVGVKTADGKTAWSDVAKWGTGIKGEFRWKGRWIGYDGLLEGDADVFNSHLGARYLRKEYDLDLSNMKRATAYISGLGLYEMYINGKKIGDFVLNPAPTDYRRTTLYDSFDITDDLRNGDNAIGVILGNGRYYTMRQNYKTYKIPTFGYPKVRLNILIENNDGSRRWLSTDESWKLTHGPIRSNNEYDGEEYDARMELGDWTSPGYDDSAWIAPQRVAYPYGTPRPNPTTGIKVMDSIRPAAIKRLANGRHLVDFGQNTAGWVKLMNLRGLSEGDTIIVQYAERLLPDSLGGGIDRENLRNSLSRDIYVASGKENGAQWAPKFSYHGFQYAEISGLEEVTPDDLIAEVVYDNVAPNGDFTSSEPVIDAILRNVKWGVTSNYKGMPVDCPQRDERQPWTGDHNMGTWGENFLFDNANLYAKWMDDMREAQREDGVIPDVCPAFWTYYTPDMTWSSTLPVVCDMLYEQTGNSKPIKDNYEAMKKWMNFIRDNYTNSKGLITADKYGDWCVPPEEPHMIHSQDPARKTDGHLIASAYFYKMSQLMAKFARLLDLPAEAEAWQTDADVVKDAFNKAFLNVNRVEGLDRVPHELRPDSVFYSNNTLTANLLPLAFDMVPEEYVGDVSDNVINTILTTNNGHISCGVIGVNWLFRQLSRMGRGDVAKLLASQKTYPSYGYMLEKGATTIWELWNGDTANKKMNSCNHVMMIGDLVAWLFRDLGGINPAAPGYKEILLRPDLSIQELGNVNASYNTPYGTVSSSWESTPMLFTWDVEIPANTTATIYLPTRDKKQVKDKGVTFVALDEDGVGSLWKAGSGKYHFEIKRDPSLGRDDRGAIVLDEFVYVPSSFPECHSATITETADGTLVCTFFGGTKEANPDCNIWVSRKPRGAAQWTEPQIAADGVFALDDPLCAIAGLSGINAESTPATAGMIGPNFKGDVDSARRKACWNPVIFRIPGQEQLMLFHKIGRRVGDWTGWVTTSDDGGVTWSERKPLPEGFLGPIKNKPEYINGRILAPSSREEKGWRAWMEYSDDMGKTWKTTGPIDSELAPMTQRPDTIEPIFSIQPGILKHPDGTLQILCRTRNARLAESFSTDNGATWSKMTLTELPNNNSGTDAVTLADGRHMLIYNPVATLTGASKGPRTPLAIAISDDGKEWRQVLTLEDSPISQYSYPSIFQTEDGLVHAIYTWRRQRIKHVVIDPSKL